MIGLIVSGLNHSMHEVLGDGDPMAHSMIKNKYNY